MMVAVSPVGRALVERVCSPDQSQGAGGCWRLQRTWLHRPRGQLLGAHQLPAGLECRPALRGHVMGDQVGWSLHAAPSKGCGTQVRAGRPPQPHSCRVFTGTPRPGVEVSSLLWPPSQPRDEHSRAVFWAPSWPVSYTRMAGPLRSSQLSLLISVATAAQLGHRERGPLAADQPTHQAKSSCQRCQEGHKEAAKLQ